MALRASYYGLKKKWAQKINNQNIIPDNTGNNNPLITKYQFMELYDFENTVGARNILRPSPNKTVVNAGITFTTADDGSVTMSGSTTATAILRYSITLQPGNYRLWGRLSDDIWVGLYVPNTGYTVSTQAENGKLFAIETPTTYEFTVRVGHPTTITPAISLISPMITLAIDPDKSDTFAPYSLTNRDLTLKVDGILAAAASAADFAAFKTALGNL